MTRLEHQSETFGDYNIIRTQIDAPNASMLKDIAFRFRSKGNFIVALGANINDKPNLALMLPDEVVKEYELNAGTIICEAAKNIRGGGGGQAFFATAGGSLCDGMDAALDSLKNQVLDGLKQ